MKKSNVEKILLKKIKDGRKEIAEGKGLSTKEAKKKLKRWLN